MLALDHPPGKQSSGRNIHLRLRLGFAGALLLLVATGLISQYCLKQWMGSSVWVAHTYDVLAELQRLSAAVHIAQRDERGYLLTPDPKLQARFFEAQTQVRSHLSQLRFLTTDNPRQQRRLDILEPLLDRSLAVQESYLASAQESRAKAAVQYAMNADRDEQVMEQIETSFREMRNEEDVLRRNRSGFSVEESLVAAVFAGTGTLLGALLIVFCGFSVNRDLRRREGAEAALRHVQEGLEARVQERTADLSQAMASLKVEMSERQKTETELRQSEQRYRLLFEDSPLPMEIFDPETLAYLAVNKAAQELYGYTAEEFRTMTLQDVRPPEEIPNTLNFLQTVKSVDAYSGTFITRHKSGKVITIEARARTIQFGGRRARLKLVTDITEHKRLERQLHQSQKIEAIGRLAGGIAHDFNNLLTVILGYSNGILATLTEGDPLRRKVSEIQAAGQRAANLTKQLLAFSRKQILKPQVLELNGVVSGISQMLQRLLGEDIQILLHLDAGLGQVQADPTQLEQVLMNLAVNARDAMPDGGQLVIESHNIELDQTTASLQGVPPGRYVVLVVSDTGCGMDEQTKTRVFEPFFTTKEVGKGTGLGLSMVLGVVQQSGGTVTIYSELGIGTTFKIYLPRLDAAVTPRTEPAHSYPLPVAIGATILLVEDEPSLRALAREVLREAGYVVFEATNGKDALRVADTLTSQPALLLSDVVMPEMSGLDLAEKLQNKWPGLAALYTSGYTDHSLLERNTLRQNMPFLQKPYMPASLLEKVAQVLSKHPSTVSIRDEEQNAEQLSLLSERLLV